MSEPGPGPSSSSSSGGAPGGAGVDKMTVLINQSLSGMPKPTTPAEWQLQAVLFRANLTQYYEKFISLGGDDVDQLMQSDESEFLEIMKLIGMASKPLHVRRFQRTLQDFSRDRSKFLQTAVASIGPPPVADLPSSSAATQMQQVFQYLNPRTSSATSIEAALIPKTLFPSAAYPSSLASSIPSMTSLAVSSTASATANVLQMSNDALLMNLVQQGSLSSLMNPLTQAAALTPASMASSIIQIPPTSRTASPQAGPSTSGAYLASPSSDREYSVGDDQPFEGGVLPEADIPIIQRLARQIFAQRKDLQSIEPRFVQNKKKLPKALLAVMELPAADPNRMAEFRKFSAIYGRYDAKRKPDKPLSYHELLVNEAAAQLCLLKPVLLTRRDELFPLSREVIKATNFTGYRTISHLESRKRPSERSQSPPSTASNRSTPDASPLQIPDRARSASTPSDAKKIKHEQHHP